MVKCLEGSHRLLEALRTKAAKHIRRNAQQEMAQIRRDLEAAYTSPRE